MGNTPSEEEKDETNEENTNADEENDNLSEDKIDGEEESESGSEDNSYPLYIYKDDPKSDPVMEYVEVDEKKKTKDDGLGNKNVKNKNLNKKENLISGLKKNTNTTTNKDNNKTLEEEKHEANDELHYITFPEDYDAYVVKFYAPWCPHCQSYKPVYVSIAKELSSRTTHERVLFMALSCVAHESICTTYNISGFPTILGFKYNGLTKKEGLILNNDDDPELTADFIGKRLHLDLIMGKDEKNKQITLEYDEDDEYVADEESNKNSIPRLFRKHTIKMQKAIQLKKDARKASIKQLQEHEYRRSLSDVYSDAGKSLIYLLRSSIYVSNSRLSEKRVSSLKAWIDLLDWTLPEEWGIKDSLVELKNEFQTIIKSKKNLLSVLDKHKLQFWGIYDIPGGTTATITTNSNKGKITNELRKYSYGCTHGNGLQIGYTCGLWHFFHIISIGASEHYLMSYFDGNQVSTKYVAETIHNFISNFFACDVCRKNFKSMYKKCGYDHCYILTNDDIPSSKLVAKELPIWLWKVHNGVNVRLIGERAKRDGRNVTKEEELAAIWPTKKMCPNCRTYNGGWNHSIVYDFLRWKYWPGYDHLSSQFLNNDNMHYLSIQNSANQSFILVPALLIGVLLIVRFILSKSRFFSGSKKHKKG